MIICIVLGIVVVFIIYLFVVYNKLVNLRNMVEEAFSTIDVYLKQRWDLIPNLVEVVKAYSKHEKSTLEEVVKLRNSNYDGMNSREKINTFEQLEPKLTKLLGLVEAYPELKAEQNYLDLMQNLRQRENDISNARKYYNATVRMLNDKIEMFPSNVVAKVFGFKEEKMFEANVLERDNVKVEL